MPDQEEGGSKILFKEAHESDQNVAWQPHATRHYTLHATLHATLPNCLEAAFWSFEAFKE